MKTSQARRALRARQRFLRDPFLRSSHQQLEHLEQRRLLSASPLTADSPDEPPVDPAWFAAVAEPAETTRMATRFLDHARGSQQGASQADLSRWIVKLSDELVAQYPTPAAANELFAPSEMEVLSGLGLPGQLLVGAHCTTTGQALEFFANEPGILYYEADTIQTGTETLPNDPRFAQQFGLHNTGQSDGAVDADINAPAAWDISTGSSDVVVAIIDSGIQADHPDLDGNLWTNTAELNGEAGVDDDNNGFTDDVHGWDFRNGDADPDDDHQHGTHVAGIIAAEGNNGQGIAGVTWNSSVMPLKFLGENNQGVTSDAVKAINYATMMRTRAENPVNVRVINNSYLTDRSAALEDAVMASAAADILFVVASGNGNPVLGTGYDLDTQPVYPASIDSTHSIVVGASGPFDELARFSNYGAETVDLVAPGVGIVSTVPTARGNYKALSGTSMAAPMVSGTAALLASHLPDITATEIKAAILGSVKPLDALQGKVTTGGRLDAAAALTIDTYRPRVTLVSSNLISHLGNASYPVTIHVRDNVAIDLATLDNDDLRLVSASGQQLNTIIAHDSTSGDADKEKTITYQVQAPAGDWSSSFNGTYTLQVVADQLGDPTGNTSLAQELGDFTVDISLAGPMSVNSTDDLPDIDLADDISHAGDGKATLRSAIMQANHTSGLDTVSVPAGTYTLTRSGAGEDMAVTGDLDVTDSLTLEGDGTSTTIINANGLDRVFDLHSGDNVVTLTLKNMTIQGGDISGDGGGILANGNLVLDNVVVTGNSVSGDGGGIRASRQLQVTGSSISGNTAGGDGAGIRFSGSEIGNFVNDSLISNNTAAGNGGGLNSTATALGALSIANLTVSGNEASAGGGIQVSSSFPTVDLTNVTVTDNRANGAGGGLRTTDKFIVATNSIIAGNHSTTHHANINVDGHLASAHGHNIIGIVGTATLTGISNGTNGNLVGTSAAPRDPGLTLLGDYGGPTLVHSLVIGSPAIDSGYADTAPDHDQRGLPRPMDGNGHDPVLPDIGAMEFKLLGEISGREFNDRNGDGIQDPGEEGLAGWTIFLDNNRNGARDIGETETTTAADGTYSFLDLMPGDYVVASTQENWELVEPTPQYAVDPAFQVGDLIATEGDSGTTTFAFSATLAWPATTVSSVDYTVTHGTTTAADLAGSSSGTLTIPAGVSSGTIEVLIQGDTDIEPVEDFRLEFSNPQGVILGGTEATGYILDNDFTFSVNTGSDTVDDNPGDGSALDANGKTSLRAAIMESNALAGFQSIHLPTGTYTLTRPGTDEDLGATGDLDITANDLAIIGAGADVTTINGAGLDRVLDIQDATGVTLADVTITGGDIPLVSPYTSVQNHGGGIRTRNSQASLYQVTMSGSTAAMYGGGLAAIAGSDVRILRSRATGNHRGGIYVDDTSAATLANSRIDNNKGITRGGGIASYGTLLVRGSVIHGNTASSSGGIYALHEATIENSLILGNSGWDGGGLHLEGNADDPGNFVLRGSSVYENTSSEGGGLYIAGSTVIDNTTIARNASGGTGGGIYVANVSNYLYDLHITSSTITENRVGTSATGGVWADSTNADLIAARHVQNTIIAGNVNIGQRFNQHENESTHNWSDVRGNLNSQGHNLASAVEVIIGGVSPWVAAEGDQVGTPADPIEAGFLSRFSRNTSSCELHDAYEIVEQWWDDGPNSCGPAHFQPPFLATQYALSADSPAVDAGDNASAGELDATGGARLATTKDPEFKSTAAITTVADGARSVHAADMNGDGDIDVLSASPIDDTIAWYENDGGDDPAFTTHVITSAANWAADVHAADVDGDGDLDVLSVSKSDNTVAWYENDGTTHPTFTQHVITNTGWPGSQSPVSVYAADVDGDGDMDVLTAAYDHKIQWYENDGDEDFTPHVITTEARYASSVYAADIDGDGDMDVLSASNDDDKITWYENDGVADPTFTTHIITRDGNGPSSVYAADIDGDGKMDVLSASDNDHKITWHRNDGAADPTFTTHTITTDAASPRSVHAADVDGDGDLDLLSASYSNNTIAWYENLGASTHGFWPTSLPSNQRVGHVITTAAGGAHSVYAADINGDGDLDILSASTTDNKIAWYMNTPQIDMGAVERKNFDPPALSRSVTLQPGDSVTNLHFGIAAMPGRIHGVQYFDSNGDGVRNTAWASEEGGTQGWQVFLDTNGNDSYDVGEPITTTDLIGYYEFDNLAPIQTYSVGAILPEGFEQSSPDMKPFPSELQTLNATTPTRQENFGNTVALSGDYLAIASAPYQQLGATYFHPRVDNVTWGEPTRVTLHSSHDDVNVFNPNSLALSSTYAIAGNHYESTQAAEGGMGSAYIFHYGDPVDFWWRPGWTNTARLRPSDGTAGDHFGWSVSVSGQTAIVGAPLHQDEQGAVYIYQENSTPDMLWNIGTSWAQVDKLMVTETSRFGSSVAISGDTVIVGAPGTNSVYVFRNLDGTWTEVATLRPAAPQDGAEFGYSMAIFDNTLVVGAPGYRANGDSVGAAYVFQRVNGLWTETARLMGSDATSDDELGQFVAITNDRILVGGRQAPYLFENHTGNWQEITQLPNLARDAQSGFGERFAISNDAIVVGARLDGPQEGSSSYHGSAYVIGSVSAFHTVSVTAGSDTGHDFGSAHQPATLEGQVYRDLDKDGVNDHNESGRDEGWKVTLRSNQTGQSVDEVITDSDGFYRFDNVTANQDYTVTHETKLLTHENTGPSASEGNFGALVQPYVADPLPDQLTDLAAIQGSEDFYFTGMDDHGRGFNSQELFYFNGQTDQLTIVSPVNDPHGLVTDQEDVYWIDYDPSGQPTIMRRLAGESENEMVYPATDSDIQLIRPIDMALISSDEQHTRLAVLDAEAGQVWDVLITPASNIISPLGPARYAAGADRHHPSYLAYDQATLYVLDNGMESFEDMPGRLYSLPLEENAWTIFYQGSLVEDAHGITIHDNWLYYSHDQWIYTQPTNGLLWAQPVVSDPRFGNLDNLSFTNGTLHVLDKTANTDAVSWQITIDSSWSAGDQQWNVRPKHGAVITGLDFGELKYGEGGGVSNDYLIAGRVYRDNNGNAQLDEGESGLADITVYLDLNNNGRQDDHEPVTTTLADIPETTGAGENEAGQYSFLDLAEGVYSVTVVPPASLQQIGPLETTFTTSTVPVSDGPRTSASHDFNGDGHADLVVGSGTSNSVAVLLNQGDGTFADPVSYTTGHGPSDIAVGDINLDGTADLAVTNINASSVSVLTGNADGTFNTATQHQVGWSPTGVVIGDVNDDNRPDMVVSNDGTDSVSVLLANAEGGFQAKTDYPAGNGPQGLVQADFDGDGDLDLAVPAIDDNAVHILANNGNGIFSTASTHAVGNAPFAISVGNVDGDQDGLLDLVIANVGSSDLSLLKGTTNGTFEPAVPIPVGNSGSTGTALVDADKDGDLDIAVTSFSATNVAILLNEGGATFQTPVSYGVGAFFYALPFDVIADDLDNDGNVDFIVANSTEDRLTILGNQLAAGPRIVTASGDSTTIGDQDIRLNDFLAPTIAPLENVEVNENSAAAAVTLRGITAGLGESQELQVEASIADGTLVSQLAVDYTNPANLGTLTIQPTSEQFGSSVVTITVTDAGPDGDLANTADNMYTTETFIYTVHELVNALPTLAGINTTTIDEDAPLQTINLDGITAGGDEEQPLSIIASSSNTELIPDPTVTYTSPQSTGSISFQGVADGFGSSVITVTVTDGGPDLDLETASDNATLQMTFTVNITPVNDKPVAGKTSFEPAQDSTISVDAAQGLLAIGSDIEDNPLSFTIVDGTHHGVLTTSADGSFSYLPNEGFNRTDFFTYRLNDGQAEHNLSDLAQVDFHIDTPHAWYNSLKPLDVNDDTITTPLDVLWIINSLNSAGARELVNARTKPLAAPFYDVNKDGHAAPLDALIVINALNMGAGEGEGESPQSYYADPLNTAPIQATDNTTQSTAPAATQLLPQDDAFRSQLAAEELAELIPADVNQDEETWRAALDQLLEEDLDLFPGNSIEDDLLR